MKCRDMGEKLSSEEQELLDSLAADGPIDGGGRAPERVVVVAVLIGLFALYLAGTLFQNREHYFHKDSVLGHKPIGELKRIGIVEVEQKNIIVKARLLLKKQSSITLVIGAGLCIFFLLSLSWYIFKGNKWSRWCFAILAVTYYVATFIESNVLLSLSRVVLLILVVLLFTGKSNVYFNASEQGELNKAV